MKSLAKRTEAEVTRRLRKVEERIQTRAQSIVAAALKAPDVELQLDAEGKPIVPEGMTKRQFNIALDAKMPVNKAPMYLGLAQRQLEVVQRLQASRNEAASLALKVVQFTEKRREYPVVDVTPIEEKNE